MLIWISTLKIPLIIALITNIVTAAWATAWLFRVHSARRASIVAGNSGAAQYRPPTTTIFYPCENASYIALRGDC